MDIVYRPDLGGDRTQSLGACRGCIKSSLFTLVVSRSFASQVDAGDVVDHDGEQRGQSLTMAEAMKTSVASAAAATTAPCSASSFSSVNCCTTKSVFL